MAPPKDAGAAAELLQQLAIPVIKFLTVAVPIVIVHAKNAYEQFQKLPQNAILFLYGSIICFFGGTFPTLFAAIKAAEHGGRAAAMIAMKELSNEAMAIIEDSKKDDTADIDKDGIADVNALSCKELMERKSLLVLRKMNPEKIDKALGSIYTVWLSVVAVLAIQFARTIALALTIADFLDKPCQRYVAPTISLAVPNEYKKWVPVLLRWAIKGVAMSFAWTIQSVMSAFASALDGGLMMARASFQFCVEHNIKLGGWIPDDHKMSYVDESFSYLFAGLGLYFQFQMGSSLPFPLNLILSPFYLVEYYIRWTITKAA